jgi:hypothetical protein
MALQLAAIRSANRRSKKSLLNSCNIGSAWTDKEGVVGTNPSCGTQRTPAVEGCMVRVSVTPPAGYRPNLFDSQLAGTMNPWMDFN